MRLLLLSALVLLLVGCTDEIVQAPPYPSFSINGDWLVHYENGDVWRLVVDRTGEYHEWGYIQPDTTLNAWMEVKVTRHPGYQTFGMYFTDFLYEYRYDCMIGTNHDTFQGRGELYDAFNHQHMEMYALIYAVRVGDAPALTMNPIGKNQWERIQ